MLTKLYFMNCLGSMLFLSVPGCVSMYATLTSCSLDTGSNPIACRGVFVYR